MSGRSKNSSTVYDSAYDSSRMDDNEDEEVDSRSNSWSSPPARSRRRSRRDRASSSSLAYSDRALSRTTYDETNRSPSRTTGYSGTPGEDRSGEAYTDTGYGSPSNRAGSSSYFAPSGEERSYSGEEDGSGSRGESGSASYDDYDYSSGYGSLSYEDSALRSPRSSSLVSSTFASFYYDHPLVQKMWDTVTFLRRPIFFLAFSVGGGGLIHGIQAMMYSMAHRTPTMPPSVPLLDGDGAISQEAKPTWPDMLQSAAQPSQTLPSCELATVTLSMDEVNKLCATTPSGTSPTAGRTTTGYPDMPQWLCEARANLPEVVVRPLSWCLRQRGCRYDPKWCPTRRRW